MTLKRKRNSKSYCYNSSKLNCQTVWLSSDKSFTQYIRTKWLGVGKDPTFAYNGGGDQNLRIFVCIYHMNGSNFSYY